MGSVALGSGLLGGIGRQLWYTHSVFNQCRLLFRFACLQPFNCWFFDWEVSVQLAILQVLHLERGISGLEFGDLLLQGFQSSLLVTLDRFSVAVEILVLLKLVSLPKPTVAGA